MTIIKPFEKELKKYCEQNSLSYDKALSFPRCGNDKVLFIQHVDKKKATKGMNSKTPAEILLSATVADSGAILFEKGANAEKYLHA